MIEVFFWIWLSSWIILSLLSFVCYKLVLLLRSSSSWISFSSNLYFSLIFSYFCSIFLIWSSLLINYFSFYRSFSWVFVCLAFYYLLSLSISLWLAVNFLFCSFWAYRALKFLWFSSLRSSSSLLVYKRVVSKVIIDSLLSSSFLMATSFCFIKFDMKTLSSVAFASS